MQNTKVLPVIGLICTLIALACNHLLPRFDIAQSRLLRIESFPEQIGEWKANADRSINVDVYRVIPTAHIVDRIYTNPSGQMVNLVLVSAPNGGDIHDPQFCFPAQGWTLKEQSAVKIETDTYSHLIAERNSEKVEILYTITGRTLQEGKGLAKLHTLRSIIAGAEGNSLLVRLIVPGDGQHYPSLVQFARQMHVPLQTLTQEAAKQANHP